MTSQIVRYAPSIRMLMVRVQREDFRTLRASICLICSLGDLEARFRVIHTSGTIRKSEEFMRNTLMQIKESAAAKLANN